MITKKSDYWNTITNPRDIDHNEPLPKENPLDVSIPITDDGDLKLSAV